MIKRRVGHRRRLSKSRLVLLLAAGYLLGLFIGCSIIITIPIATHRTELVNMARDRAEHTLFVFSPYDKATFGTEYYLYDRFGRLITSENLFLSADARAGLADYLPELFENGSLYLPTLLEVDSLSSPKCFGLIAGIIVEGHNDNMFASLVVRDFVDLGTTMETFIALYTIIYLTAVFFVVVVVRKERELNSMQRDLVANVSHELKTPITTIRALSEVIHDGLCKDEQTRREYSMAILRESDRLEQLVLDILELSRLQSKRAEFKKELTHANGILPPVIDRYIMLCGDLGISLSTDGLDLDSVPTLHTDSQKIVSLLTILMDNAVKFAGKGGCIWLSQNVSLRHVTFCVRDNGPGIAPGDIDRIFERFYKADIPHNTAGSGLGLAIADEIARGLGEKLWVESSPGSGSSFFFTVGF